MAKLKALVCDDEAPLRDLMARRLEKMGLEVERAESGKDARAQIEANRYDLLVTDIYMPDVTGLELLQQMKAMDAHAQVVVVTASATLDNAVQALNHGAFAYLTKPFDHLIVFDNVVSRAVELRRALLDNLRMGEVQRRRGDMLEEEVAGRIQQLKRTQVYLTRLLSCLPFGVAVLDHKGRAEILNPQAERDLEAVLAQGGESVLSLIDSIPLIDGVRHGEIELGGRTLDVFLSELGLEGDDPQMVIVLREPEAGGPMMGTLVEETLLNLRRGLTWMARREKEQDARRIIRGMATEVASLANLLDVELVHDDGPDRDKPQRVFEEAESAGEPLAEAPEDDTGLARAVIPPRPEPFEPDREPSEPVLEASTAGAPKPGNGKDAPRELERRRPPSAPDAPGQQKTGSLLLRKGMTMVLEGQIRRKRPRTEPLPSPAATNAFQEKIERWARGEEDDGGPANWPPTLPSSED